ncbi:Gp37 family protein [Enterobacter roggenkampii]|uniref:Gp37 family protein n=1 Tax=Enterobacter roggenkampii TaxID=1812935 RepID=UPI002018102F|nr:Gp37 family protein [Enterobacter roggenkampii]
MSYAGSRFDKPNDIGAVLQDSDYPALRHGSFSASSTVKEARLTFWMQSVASSVGYTPPNCRRRIWLTREVFIGEVKGCGSTPSTLPLKAFFIEDSDLPSGPLLTEVKL